MRIFILIVLTLFAACAPRGEIEFAPPVPGAELHTIWTAKFRSDRQPGQGQRSPPRPEKLVFERNQISVPKTHQPGQIEWPKGLPDAATDFVTLSQETVNGIDTFAQAVRNSDGKTSQPIFLFVHGYNYTHAEAVYQMAQIVHDFDVPAPPVLFSWPSAGVPFGYLYDRDSALIARDALEDLLIALTNVPGAEVTILAHSMGNFLVMETLRQMEISGSINIEKKIAELIMISPDIDGELFYRQASRLRDLPEPTVILAAKQDKALRLSARLTGRSNRLGSETDRNAVRDLPVLVIDTSALGANGSNHSIPFSSPTAIAILKKAGPDNLPGETVEPGLVRLTDAIR